MPRARTPRSGTPGTATDDGGVSGGAPSDTPWSCEDKSVLLTTLFSLPTTLALDVDDEGRMLVLYDGTGTRQVNEVDPDGTWRALTDLDDTCRGARFVP